MKWTEFFQKMYSDAGAPSSSRFLSSILSIFAGFVICKIVNHMCNLHDNAALALWLTSLPLIVAALVGLAAAPYAINRGSGSITDVLTAMVTKRQ